ncbi:PREDICTED: embryonic stem cell-specific 5-hydroxymethylcytosine-binding protein-like [Amphimedon queenslandica]|uniref:Abasic site processing protein HMCES n=1 Tax=Amphimedon queenslandica TaxID=400682 RepID=A0A1X7V325_AMPQE|nr:PREDICTED: embryonic stem cell-specific 5-hydroxymethylcytosine-binding protein-like [Amphimedon queenslandica]|eukprot:XP_003385948.1 PREDICTED: embryonic stem cell-specific 5-hydroxymethylcytosine-binding protein-like [Amphimedon queenslandica]
MCGRCACALDPQDIRRACSYNCSKAAAESQSASSTVVEPVWITANKGQEYYPSYNVAPQSNTPVLISDQHHHVQRLLSDYEEKTERVIQVMKWGLVPQWHRGSDCKSFPTLLNNCRFDGMFDKPSFRPAISRRQRCVVLCQGFYEWKRDKKKKEKQPYFVYFKDGALSLDKKSEATALSPPAPPPSSRLLTLAGLYDVWTPDSFSSEDTLSSLYTYTVITVDATPSFNDIHDRLPAVLEDDTAISMWLDTSIPTSQAVRCFNPRGSDSLSWHPVSSYVNNVRNKSSECVVKINEELKKKGTLHNWFKSASSSSVSCSVTPAGDSPPLPKRSKKEC